MVTYLVGFFLAIAMQLFLKSVSKKENKISIDCIGIPLFFKKDKQVEENSHFFVYSFLIKKLTRNPLQKIESILIKSTYPVQFENLIDNENGVLLSNKEALISLDNLMDNDYLIIDILSSSNDKLFFKEDNVIYSVVPEVKCDHIKKGWLVEISMMTNLKSSSSLKTPFLLRIVILILSYILINISITFYISNFLFEISKLFDGQFDFSNLINYLLVIFILLVFFNEMLSEKDIRFSTHLFDYVKKSYEIPDEIKIIEKYPTIVM